MKVVYYRDYVCETCGNQFNNPYDGSTKRRCPMCGSFKFHKTEDAPKEISAGQDVIRYLHYARVGGTA